MNDAKQLIYRYMTFIENEDRVDSKIMLATNNRYAYLKLNATERAIAHMVYVEKREVEDVARTLKVQVGTVTRTLRTLKKKLTDPTHAIYWRKNLLDRYSHVMNEDHISSLNLSLMVQNALLSQGYQTITTLQTFTKDELTKIKGIGDVSANLIMNAIDEYHK